MAELEDLEVIVEIYNQAIVAGQKTADTEPFTPEERIKWFEVHSPDKYPILVAEKDDVIVGYVSISAYRPGRMALRHTAEVSYYIHFDYHHQGIASNLLQYAIDMCPALQIKNLFAILFYSNQGSIKLLEKFGFEKWGYLPRVIDLDGIEYGHAYYGLRIK